MRVRFRLDQDGVAFIEMQDAETKNGFSPAFVEDLLAALDEASSPSVRVAVLSGLPNVFSSGATEEVLADLAEGRMHPTELLLGRRLMAVPVPVIAAAEGHAVGGGFALMLSADLIVAARESRYGATFLSLGITPGMGTTRLLEQVLSPAVAHELLYTGELRRGDRFEGAFNAVVPKNEVRQRAKMLARAVVEKPPEAVRLLKQTLTLPRRRAFEESLTLESLMHRLTLPNLKKELL